MNTKKIEIQKIKEQVNRALAQCESCMVISNKEEYEQAVEFGKKVSKLIKMIDTKEKSITRPINESLKEIRAMFKPYKEQAETLKNQTKQAMMSYIQAEEAKRKEQEAKITARVEKGTMREDTAVAKLSTMEEEATNTTRNFTSVLRVEVLDIKQIPAEYLTVNETAIKQAFRDGVEVPGVTCFYEKVARL